MANNLEQGRAEAAHMERLIKVAQEKAERNQLKDVHGSLLVSVDRKGVEPGALVRLDRHKDGEQSGSELPLQDEFSFHLMLAARVYEQIAKKSRPDIDLTKIEIARQDAMKRVNRYIERAYRDASKIAKKDGEFDLAKFNASLDKARKKLVPMAHTILMEKIIEKTGVIFTAKDFKDAKHTAENMPATTQDILYVNQAAGLVTLIKGSEYTAHHRVAGKEAFAHRQMITCRRNKDGTIRAGLNPRIQIRTPSPVVKKKEKDFGDHEIISDVVAKLSEVTEFYQLDKKLSSDKPRAFIYNRYTAIHDRIGDVKGNLQTQSAAHILQGAHEYNATHDVMCFVQNISVNGFGKTLSYKSSRPLVRESTLMAEMALMHTLCNTSEINRLVDNYKHYLESSPREPYFSDSKYGTAAIAQIKKIKAQWKNEKSTKVPELDAGEKDEELVLAVKNSLKKLVAHDAHGTHEYAKLVQTLSVFSEEASIGGCKSGNERAQAINGRVLMLDGMKSGSKLAKRLKLLASASLKNVLSRAEKLNECLNEEYNQKGLYAAASVISLVDQGASAKVEAKSKWWNISRNFAEESAEQMTNLKQSKAGAMQAHKGLTKSMKGAWNNYAMSDWSYMSSSSAGVLGAVAAVMTVIPAILAVLKNRQNKHIKINARRMHNERIQALEKCPIKQKDKIKDWLKHIGNYEVKPKPDESKPNAPLHLSHKEKKALYRKTHQGTTPKGAREDFIRFLGLKFLDGNALDTTVAMSDNAVTLKELLGEEGFRLYKKAIKEEGKSKSFRKAVFSRALDHVEGPRWSKRLILWVGGPSSSGKTYSAKNVLEHLTHEESDPLDADENNMSGNNVVFADGSYDREVSQMRQMVLQCALASGYKGISDLYKQSQALMLRGYLKDTVMASDRFSLVIPETFTRPGAAKEIARYEWLSRSKKSNFVQLFSKIKAEESEDKDKDEQRKHTDRFRTAVKNTGESRTWRTEPFNASEIKMNNLNIGCESKIYEPKNFWWGRILTESFEKMYKKYSEAKATLKVTHDLMYLQKDAQGKWRECESSDNLTGKKDGEEFVCVTARAYENWLSLDEDKRPDLAEWYKEHKKESQLTGPLIKYKENDKYRRESLSSLSSGGYRFFSQKSGDAEAVAEKDSEKENRKKQEPPAA
jgi:hypothetical protein